MALQVPVLIEGVRLRLRRSTPADAAATFNWVSDPEVMHYMEWPAPQRLADTQDFFDGCAARWQSGAEYHWMVERKAGAAVGCISCRIHGHAADFGYFLARESWGQGFASEAAGLLVNWLRRQGSIVRIGATTDIDNHASAAVLQKVGLKREGLMRSATVRPNIGPPFNNTPRDTLLFASVRPDWTPA